MKKKKVAVVGVSFGLKLLATKKFLPPPSKAFFANERGCRWSFFEAYEEIPSHLPLTNLSFFFPTRRARAEG